ncbi:MAG: hypothetical protein Fues2KO_46990 [Fuerstiella sp.]
MNQPGLPQPETGICFDARVVRVIDGDTIEVTPDVTHRVRLIDCWCEETRLGRHTDEDDKAAGLAAKAHLEGLLAGCDNRVRIHIPGQQGDLSKLSTLGRLIGRAWRRITDRSPDPTDVSGLMVRDGHAKAKKPER